MIIGKANVPAEDLLEADEILHSCDRVAEAPAEQQGNMPTPLASLEAAKTRLLCDKASPSAEALYSKPLREFELFRG